VPAWDPGDLQRTWIKRELSKKTTYQTPPTSLQKGEKRKREKSFKRSVFEDPSRTRVKVKKGKGHQELKARPKKKDRGKLFCSKLTRKGLKKEKTVHDHGNQKGRKR